MKKIIVILSVFTFLSAADAHEGAKGIVKERMDIMGEIAGAMKIIGQMIKGEVKYDAEQAKLAALDIGNHGDAVSGMFPEGSIEKPSEALPKIWEDWEEFITLFGEMRSESEKLAVLAVTSNSAVELRV